MASAREMRLRIRSVKNIGQVTRALEAVSASKVRRATQALEDTCPYSEKAWKVLIHLARQPGRQSLHPLLSERAEVHKVLIIMISSDRGLAGASNMNVLRRTLEFSSSLTAPLFYIPIGKKGRDLLWRRKKNIVADFSQLPSPPTFTDVSAIGRLVVDDFLNLGYDQVYLIFNEFYNLMSQEPVVRKLLPLDVEYAAPDVSGPNITHSQTKAVFTYEPDPEEMLNEIIPRFTALQIYQCILSAQASEHAARMVAMKNATDNAHDLAGFLQLEYNKARQQSITNDLLDIAGGAEAMNVAR
jgi:F-type H+-transporting ATPase subunit gamma